MVARLLAKHRRDIRQRIESRWNGRDGHAFDFFQGGHHHVAPRLVAQAHGFNCIPGAFQRFDGGALHELVGPGSDCALNARNRLADRLNGGGIAQPPSRHGEALGKAIDRNGALTHAGQCSDRRHGPFENDVLIDLIGQHHHLRMGQHNGSDFCKLGRRPYGPARIAWRIQDEQLGARRHCRRDARCRNLVAFTDAGMQHNRRSAGKADSCLVGYPEGRQHDDFVARIDDRKHRIGDGLLGPIGENDFAWPVVEIVFGLELL